MIRRLFTFILVSLFLSLGNCASAKTEYLHRNIRGLDVHIIKTDASQVNIQYSTKSQSLKSRIMPKGYLGGINASYFNMNNLKPCGVTVVDNKVIARNIYNRPYLAISKDGKAYISKSSDLSNVLYASGGGSNLVSNGKINITCEHFPKSFLSSKWNRTIVGVTKDNKVLLVLVRNASLYDCAKVMLSLGAEFSINMDGGTSSQMFYGTKYIASTSRYTPVIIVTK